MSRGAEIILPDSPCSLLGDLQEPNTCACFIPRDTELPIGAWGF